MTKALPFTAAGIARVLKGAEKAGKSAILQGDGTFAFVDISERSPLISDPEAQADPFVVAAGNARHAKAKRSRNRAAT